MDLHGCEGLGISKTDRVGIMVFHFVLEMVEMSITFGGRHFAGGGGRSSIDGNAVGYLWLNIK